MTQGHSFRRPASDASAIRNYPLLLKRYERIMEISRSLASTLDLASLLRRIIEAAIEVTGTEASSILLVDSRSGELRFEATTSHAASAMEGLIIPMEGSLAGWIVGHGESLVVHDTSQDTRFFQGVDKATSFTTRSLLGVPLQTKTKTIGVLEALNKRTGSFNDDDVATLEALAGHAAVAIEVARLFQQSDLIAEMVHELRTPLASLSASTHLLVRPDLPPEKRREIIDTIHGETARLSQMTTDFLDLSKLESGRARFVREPFDFARLAAQCLSQISAQASARGIAVDNRVPPGLPALHGDRAKIKQVLLNLLTNAVKYNREGGAITVAAQPEGAFCRIDVRDTGRGIPEDSLPHIFEKFFRVAETEGMAQGTGLGLAIAKRIVETHRGEMTVTSHVDAGTTFSFTLPLHAEESVHVRNPEP